LNASGTPSALAGIRILDFTHALSGPYCTMLLSDYGATVYKLEHPGGGDMGRGWGPPFAGDQASFFLGLNRGKHGIAINLKDRRGVALCLDLVDRMDVLVENFRPGTMQRLGLGYETVHRRNPRLVYCSISGYGLDGPSRDEAAMDLIVQCSSGLVSMTGTEAGEQVRCGYSVADVTSGLVAAIGILAALRSRDVTGEGQLVDVSMQDSMISTMSSNYATYLGSGRVPRPLGTAFPTVVPYRVFDGSDRGFAIAVGSEKLWTAFCKVIGRPELETAPRFVTNAERVKNRPALERILADVFREKTAAEWIDQLRSVGIPCTPVRNFEEVVAHPQSAHRAMFPTLDHPTAGEHRVTGTPVKMSATPGCYTRPAPLLGQDTRSVLADLLGLPPEAAEELLAAGVIGEPPARDT
jgi:crotonobetainyl-CoA:carnitine CoA-transferase CaiB-like acyl-CoA transferase